MILNYYALQSFEREYTKHEKEMLISCFAHPYILLYHTGSLLKDYDGMSFRILNTTLFAMWVRDKVPMNIKIALDIEGSLYQERQKDTNLLGK